MHLPEEAAGAVPMCVRESVICKAIEIGLAHHMLLQKNCVTEMHPNLSRYVVKYPNSMVTAISFEKQLLGAIENLGKIIAGEWVLVIFND